ncbi:uncharacterized protein LOC62_05G007613 [Vanrija pseudolonga]|uniref:Uncharacterized protein n=1 Tax=Vanrija pseudolonga TaxID=143232 RepID=A0AAF0YGA2_9TREE|nr:hypothetical protein LOC62_05G007613 [Vanrija pseudolonga]
MSNGYYSNGYSNSYSNGYYANGYTNTNTSRGQVTYASQDEEYPSVFESSSESGGDDNNSNNDGNSSTSESEDGPVQRTITCTCNCCDHSGREHREAGYMGQRIN